MPKWIHERAKHLLASQPDMAKGMAFALATQQAHALGKSPKSYGTAEGRETAKEKYDTPKDDKKMANPGNLKTPKLAAAPPAQEEPAEKPMGAAKKFGLGFAGTVAAGGANAGLGHLMQRAVQNPVEGDEALLGRVRVNTKVPIVDAPEFPNAAFVGHAGAAKTLSAQYNADIPTGPKGAVVLGRGMQSPSVLSHELGHADIHQNRAGRVLQNPVTIGSGMMSGAIGSLSGLATGALSDNPTVHRWGLAAPALAAAPMLAYEAGATLKGIGHMRRAGANKKQMMQFAKTLAPAWGTYATHAAGGVAGAAQAQGMAQGVRGLVKKQKAENAPSVKQAFTVSQYSGPLGPVVFPQASQLPPRTAPRLDKVVDKPKEAAALSPAGRLVATQQTGKGLGKSPPGPSIASIAKPPGMGHVLPGAQKNQI